MTLVIVLGVLMTFIIAILTAGYNDRPGANK